MYTKKKNIFFIANNFSLGSLNATLDIVKCFFYRGEA